ncbi:MAG: GspH/FimT family pseudopilin [Pseudomonadota bacterium]
MTSAKQHLGFSLIELMVTLAIMAILATIAFPSMTSMSTSNRISTTSNDLVTTLNFARLEAVRKGKSMSVTSLGADLKTWSDGVVVFPSSGDQAQDALRKVETVRGSIIAQTDADLVKFDGRGFANNQTSITICDPNDKAIEGRVIVVEGSGRITVDKVNCQNFGEV